MISDEKLFEVAIAYYVKKKLQREIAAEFGVSHVQISKYLKLAEDRGIVSISINPPGISKEDGQWYSVLFKEMFGLKNLVLTPGSNNYDKAHSQLVDAASRYIYERYPNRMTNIGLGWGRTMFDIAKMETGQPAKSNWMYYPLAAPVMSHSDDYFNYDLIVSNFITHWGGGIDPQFSDCIHLHDGKLDFSKLIQQYWRKLDLILCGIGISFTRYPTSRGQLFSADVLKQIDSKDIAGDLANYFFDINGKVYSLKEGVQMVVPLDVLNDVPEVVAVATGFQKVVSVIGALRTGIVDTLITDIETARHMVEYLK
ncbi:MAG: sugar-binding domain-containing protein [Sphaerochaetaceae bacterium]|jgi:DNA-binding transcriptional regulator LsrR (DeoR family)